MSNIVLSSKDLNYSKIIVMYDDDYETKYGDGYYPQIKKYDGNPKSYPSKNITFTLINIITNDTTDNIINCWYQSTNISILGLDGDECGKELLELLNNDNNICKTNIIYNKNFNQIYPKIKNN